MTLAKRLLLGSAAAFVATSGAQAADLGLPVAPAVDYVQICSIGSFTGFLLPGSDVCFDISGFARWQVTFDGEGSDGGTFARSFDVTDAALGAAGFGAAGTTDTVIAATAGADNDDDFDMVGEIDLNFDARTMTEWGLLRGFIGISGDAGAEDFNAVVDKVFVQVGGLTAGITDSFFDPVWTDYAMAPFGDITGTEDLALIGYALGLGNGVTFMASLEDGEARNTGIASYVDANRGIANGAAYANAGQATATLTTAGVATTQTGAGGAVALNVTGYDESATLPDFVAAIRVDQAWGTAKVSAALHEIDPFQPTVDSEFGFALGASAEFNLPVGMDTSFGIFGNYAHGAVEYVGFDDDIGQTKLPWVDAIYDASANDLELTTAWGLGAGVNVGLTNTISWQLEGYYTYIDHADVTMTVIDEQDVTNATNYQAGEDPLTTRTIDYDGSIMAIRSSVTYVPFSGLTLQAGLSYQTSDFDSTITGAGADDDQFGGRIRITRSF